MEVEACRHLGYTPSRIETERYFAEVTKGFGVCVYTVNNISRTIRGTAFVQFFPIKGEDLTAEYIDFVLHKAKSRFIDDPTGIYPYHEVQDILTLKCLIEEAAERWRAACNSN